MKKLSRRTIGERVLAAVLAWLMVISILPMPSIQVHAATTEHPDCVTITVKDSSDKPIEGATVVYTVKKDPNSVAVDEFETVDGSATTDANGTVEVLAASSFKADMLLISATVTKDGYDAGALSETSIATDNADFTVTLTETKPEIEGVVINVLNNGYSGSAQELITSVETTTEGVTIEYSTDNSMWSGEKPTGTDAGDYSVYVKITKDGHKDYISEKLTATITTIDIETNVSIAGKELTYSGNAQALVDFTGAFEVGDKVQWTVNGTPGGFWEITEENKNETKIPTGINEGAYKVKLEIDRGINYKLFATGEVASSIGKKVPTLTFTGVTGEKSYVSVEKDIFDSAEGQVYDFSATHDSTGTVTYDVEFPGEYGDNIALIDTDGKLKVTAPGVFTVKATVSETANYEAKTITHTLYVGGAETDTAGTWVKFAEESADYVVGNKDGIPSKTASAVYNADNDSITYSIDNANDIGLIIDGNTGEITINNYGKLIAAVEEAENGTLGVIVKAAKAAKEVEFDAEKKIIYPADECTYTINITLADVPQEAYTIYYTSDQSNALTGGENVWFNKAVTIIPNAEYQVIKGDVLAQTENDIVFNDSVEFGALVDGVALEQGANTERVVYLQNKTSKEITKRIVTDVINLDTVAPNNVTILFPEVEENEDVKYYKDGIQIVFTAEDSTSGVSEFMWKYIPAGSDSSEQQFVSIGSENIVEEDGKYKATITLPEETAQQMKGKLEVYAVDVAGKESLKVTSERVFVIDTVEPKLIAATYELNGEGTTQETESKHYFSNDVLFTFKVKETNFFAKDVVITVLKKGEDPAIQEELSWISRNNDDVYETTIELSDEGEYLVNMTYIDRSGNVMKAYQIEKPIVIDKTAPELSFEYKDHKDVTNPQTAIITVTEHNFSKNNIVVEVTQAKDITGQDVSAPDLQTYLRKCEWTSEGDKHTATISDEFADAIYKLKINYKDMALNAAETVDTAEFTVDDTIRDDVSISYSNTHRITEVILSTITFGVYKPSVEVTFTAYDDTSGIAYFTWNYERQANVSESYKPSYGGVIKKEQITVDGNKFTATVKLPKEEAQSIRGTISVSATDNCDNISNTFTDDGYVIVVDNVSASQSVSYMIKEQLNGDNYPMVDGKYYIDSAIEFIFSVTNANFEPEDVTIKVSKNGKETKVDHKENWSDGTQADEHVTTLKLEEDGEYVVSMTYKSHFAAEGEAPYTYTSDTWVIDNTNPKVTFAYNAQTADITVTEHNFNKENIVIEVLEAKDIKGQAVTAPDLQAYLRKCEWTSEGDIHTATISDEFVDAIYKLKVDYTDLAGRTSNTVVTDNFTVDHTNPYDVSIAYPDETIIPKVVDTFFSAVTLGFYKPGVTITFTAYDDTSGINCFTWSYERQADVSESNKPSDGGVIKKEQITVDGNKFTANVTLPKETADQLRGHISVTATDGCNNSSNKLTNDKYAIVVDTVSPEITVEYSAANYTVEDVEIVDTTVNEGEGATTTTEKVDKAYYNADLTVTFTVEEANFFKEDIHVSMVKDGGNPVDISNDIKWQQQTEDDIKAGKNIGTYTLTALDDHTNDGEYKFIIEGAENADKSQNEAIVGEGENEKKATYTSDIKVIDTIKPEVSVAYSNTSPQSVLADAQGNSRKYFVAANTATITVKEHNFYKEGVVLSIDTKNAANGAMDASGLYTKTEWVSDGDTHTMTINYTGESNYTFDVVCSDLAQTKAADYPADHFTIDRTAPTNLSMSYSTGVLETILSNITFGFYNAKVTVTISATDNISGINAFRYSYINEAGVSNVNAQLTDVSIAASGISFSNGVASGTAKIDIPRDALGGNNQFNGTVKFSAADRTGNESNVYGDSKRIVVDNIAPTANVQYNAPVQVIGNVSYYDGPINASVVINEANFYAEDVHIEVTKDGATNAVNATWASNGDLHTGTFNLTEDGDYSVRVTYMDKSNNTMQEYVSEPMTIDTDIVAPTITINGSDGNGKAFKDDISVNVNFEDTNYESYEVKLYRISYAEKNVDVTDKFVTGHINTNATGGNGTFATFEKNADNDGIYTLTVMMRDKAGHTSETSTTFTVNRFGSVYEYSDYLVTLIQNGGAYVQGVTDDLVITEYNADRLVANSLNIEISKDGKPLDEVIYEVTPEINDMVEQGESGWFQYAYIISKDNFNSDGIYKISISSQDAAGNSPENNNYKDKDILFRVDRTVPEITSITGLEEEVVNATEQIVKYTVFDAIGLQSIVVYVNGKEVANITDFAEDANNYLGEFTLTESTSAQKVRIVVTDMAGNITDTSSETFTSSYAFSDSVTVSTNVLVRWYANKALFFGSIATAVVAIGGSVGLGVFLKKKKKLA